MSTAGKPTRDQHVQTDKSAPHEEDSQSRQTGSPGSSSHQDTAHRRGWRHEYRVVHGRIVDGSPENSDTENDGHLSNLPEPSGSPTCSSDHLGPSHLPSKLTGRPWGLMTQSMPAIRPRPPGELCFHLLEIVTHACKSCQMQCARVQAARRLMQDFNHEALVSRSILSLCGLCRPTGAYWSYTLDGSKLAAQRSSVLCRQAFGIISQEASGPHGQIHTEWSVIRAHKGSKTSACWLCWRHAASGTRAT